jgi:predicted DNA-binding protein (UPF0251 family)
VPRPLKCRRVGRKPGIDYFKPRGIPLRLLEEVVLAVDEFEAIRLADLEGLYQERAADRMRVSRQTFGNILAAAHGKVARAIVEGKALRIAGGVFAMTGLRKFKCFGCGHEWELAYGIGRPAECPKCRGGDFCRTDGGRGCGGRGCGGLGRGRRTGPLGPEATERKEKR